MVGQTILGGFVHPLRLWIDSYKCGFTQNLGDSLPPIGSSPCDASTLPRSCSTVCVAVVLFEIEQESAPSWCGQTCLRNFNKARCGLCLWDGGVGPIWKSYIRNNVGTSQLLNYTFFLPLRNGIVKSCWSALHTDTRSLWEHVGRTTLWRTLLPRKSPS